MYRNYQESGLATSTIVVVPLNKVAAGENGQVERQDRLDLGMPNWWNLAAHEVIGNTID